MPLDNFPPPLTREELREIGLRRDGADVIRLLWEIKRLRILILRADQIVKQNPHGGFLVDVFRQELEGEPVIEEEERWRAQFALSETAPRRRGTRYADK